MKSGPVEPKTYLALLDKGNSEEGHCLPFYSSPFLSLLTLFYQIENTHHRFQPLLIFKPRIPSVSSREGKILIAKDERKRENAFLEGRFVSRASLCFGCSGTPFPCSHILLKIFVHHQLAIPTSSMNTNHEIGRVQPIFHCYAPMKPSALFVVLPFDEIIAPYASNAVSPLPCLMVPVHPPPLSPTDPRHPQIPTPISVCFGPLCRLCQCRPLVVSHDPLHQ